MSVTPGRNDPCPCGSGRKYKRCCLRKKQEKERADATFGRHGLSSPLAAVHELDLRTFLFDWYVRKVIDAETRARAMPVSL